MARGDDARLTFAFRTAPHPYRPTTAQQVQKNGTGEHIPPPRPKRKSAQPYPQKSSAGGRGAEARKKPHAGAGAGAGGGGSNVMGPGGGMAGGGMSAGAGLANGLGPLGNQGRLNRGVPLEFGAPVPGGGYLVHARGGDARWGPSPGLQAGGMAHGGNPSGYPATGGGSLSFGGGSFGGSLGADPRGAGLSGPDGSDAMRAHASPLRKHPTSNPDFVVVYTFLAGLFDPNQRGHADKLRQMRAIDRETASLLMRNLGANLMCQRMWEDQIQLIGQGHPTFVNATYDERGGLTGDSSIGTSDGVQINLVEPSEAAQTMMPASGCVEVVGTVRDTGSVSPLRVAAFGDDFDLKNYDDLIGLAGDKYAALFR